MDISFAKLTRPPLRARYCPIYWEPQAGAHDRITALIALVPELESAGHFAAAAHCILPAPKLRAMLGSARGASAHGILHEAAQFMTQQLAAGLALEDLTSPFTGFTVGTVREVRGFTAEQLLTAAVQTVSTLGSAEELTDDVEIIDSRRTTSTTRKFLREVRRAFAGDSKELRGRFNQTYRAGLTTEITLDYQHNQWLVQFASLPSSLHQASYLEHEAESKLFEIISAQTTINAPTKPLLIINSLALSDPSEDTKHLAARMLNRFRGLAEIHRIETFSAASESAAVRQLEILTP